MTPCGTWISTLGRKPSLKCIFRFFKPPNQTPFLIALVRGFNISTIISFSSSKSSSTKIKNLPLYSEKIGVFKQWMAATCAFRSTQFSPRSWSVRRFTNRGAFGFAVSQGTDAVQHLTGFMDRFPGSKNPKLQMVMPPSMMKTWKCEFHPLFFGDSS